MIYDFDAPIDRLGTDCEKWDGLKERFGRDGVLPLWVADMDFPAPEPVLRAIRERAAHPVFGYPRRGEDYYDSFAAWEKKRWGWDVDLKWCSYVPGVVCGVGAALLGFTAPGDGVMIMPPVYHPFRNTILAQGRRVVNAPMRLENGRFEIDFDALEAGARQARALILCSPHNPSGRLFSRAELERVAAVCEKNELLVISDEIHSDLALWGGRHVPFADVSVWTREHSITLMAPSKTFNLAGLVASIAVVPNERLRSQFGRIVSGWMHVGGGNIFGLTAARAAYADGEEWYRQMLAYIEGNVDYLDEQLKKRVPRIRLIRPEATYIPLLDCRDMGMTMDEIQDFMLNRAQAALNEGTLFGAEGDGFLRINLGTQRARIEEFVRRVESAAAAL